MASTELADCCARAVEDRHVTARRTPSRNLTDSRMQQLRVAGECRCETLART